jgi:hypothetical protein
VDWPATGAWLNLNDKPTQFHPRPSWMGSLLAHGQDASGQYYRRNRYSDAGTGRCLPQLRQQPRSMSSSLLIPDAASDCAEKALRGSRIRERKACVRRGTLGRDEYRNF